MTKAHHQNMADGVVLDARADNWVYRWAPKRLQGFLKLARLDRPVGVWLLLWPCWWSLFLAPSFDFTGWTFMGFMALFAAGSLAMRGAGCTYNDVIDRDFDARVARTASRPLPAGDVTLTGAILFMIAQGLIGLAVLLQFNSFAILLGASSLILVFCYPFMKRITWWPQVWLGLTFNWGALMGWAVLEGSLALVPFLVFAAAFFWTLGYDTIYAHQDREDDALIGVKSSARRLGSATGRALIVFYGMFALLLIAAAYLALPNLGFLPFFLWAFWGLLRQIRLLDIDDSEVCLGLFKSNIRLGGWIFLGLVCSRLAVHFYP